MESRSGEDRIRLLLLANQALFRTSLSRLLAAEQNLAVVLEQGSFPEALGTLASGNIDVVILDYDDDAEGRDEFMVTARRNGYQGRFLVVTGAVEPADIAVTIRHGAAGIFPKSDNPERLVQAITLIASGGVWLDEGMLRSLADQPIERFSTKGTPPAGGDSLTLREQQVLSGILSGLTNKKIGENLGISEATVKTSVQQLFFRAGVRKRSQLVRAALEGTINGANKRLHAGLIERLPV